MAKPGDKVHAPKGLFEGVEGRVTFSADRLGNPMVLVTNDPLLVNFGDVVSIRDEYLVVLPEADRYQSDLHKAIDTILPFV